MPFTRIHFRPTRGHAVLLAVVSLLSGGVTIAPVAAGSTVSPAAPSPAAALLPTAKMPQASELQAWKTIATRTSRLSLAQRGLLGDLGFSSYARRDFTLSGSCASNVVVTFDTPEKATVAYAKVRGWRRDIKARVPAGGQLLRTGDLSYVRVPDGKAAFFDFVWLADRRAVEGSFDWVGVTVHGSSLSIITWGVGGMDADYEVDPTVASLRAASAALAAAS